MKPFLALLVLGVLIAAPVDLPAAAKTRARIATPKVFVANGMTPAEVQSMLGMPDLRVGPATWVYWEFRARDRGDAARWDTLVVHFAEGRVSVIRLTRSEAVRGYLAERGLVPAARSRD